MTVGRMFRSTCRVSTRAGVAPSAWAARTYSLSRAASTAPRTRRVTVGVPQMPTAMVVLSTPGPRAETNRDGEEQVGEGEEDLHPAHDHHVEPSSREAGEAAQGEAQAEGDGHGEQTNEEGDPAAVDDAREDVPPELVGAEEELLARPRALLDEALPGRVGGREPGGSHRSHGEESDHDEADEGETVPPEPLPGVSGERGGRFSSHDSTSPSPS